MGIKLRAAAKTAKMFALASIIPIFIIGLFQLDGETVFYIFLTLFFSWMIWVVYSINLRQLESEDSIEAIKERRETMISGMIKE